MASELLAAANDGATDASLRGGVVPAMPSLYISHGAGPCFFIANPKGGAGAWDGLRRSLRAAPRLLPRRPRAIVVVSAHWETTGFRVTDAVRPPLVYDYFNYPPDAYEITYPVAGDPFLASRICGLLTANGLFARTDPRGLDHAVFIPLKVMYPDADVPVVALSLDRSLDPGLHLRVGAALARLRSEDILIVGSGSSFHGRDPHESAAQAFDDWLDDAIRDGETRAERLVRWEQAAGARGAHPREEHLIPLMVASGATGVLPGQRISLDYVGGSPISGFLFG